MLATKNSQSSSSDPSAQSMSESHFLLSSTQSPLSHVKPSGKQSENVMVCVSPLERLHIPLEALSGF